MSTVSFTCWNKNVCVVIIDLISMQRMFVDWPINMGSFHQMFYFFDKIKFYNIYSYHRWQLIHFIIVIHYIDFSSQMKECKFHFFQHFVYLNRINPLGTHAWHYLACHLVLFLIECIYRYSTRYQYECIEIRFVQIMLFNEP